MYSDIMRHSRHTPQASPFCLCGTFRINSVWEFESTFSRGRLRGRFKVSDIRIIARMPRVGVKSLVISFVCVFVIYVAMRLRLCAKERKMKDD